MLQRGLPRPLSLEHGPQARNAEEAGQLSQREAAEALLFTEMKALLQHDAAKYPVKESKKDRKVIKMPYLLSLACNPLGLGAGHCCDADTSLIV